MDRWLIRYLLTNYGNDADYCKNLGIVLANNQVLAWFCRKKAPEAKDQVNSLIAIAPKKLTNQEIRAAEDFILDRLDWAVVYVDPEVMNKNCNYIYNWDKQRLLELADFNDKLVLDVGSGTGRLTFAAAPYAKRVYASEPVDMLREFMRDKIANENITNVIVVDGFITKIPYEDNTFDIVMSGHVIGDDYENEINEMIRVVKNRGVIIDCMGDDDRKRNGPDQELIDRGFDFFYHKSNLGGDIYRYRKMVNKEVRR